MALGVPEVIWNSATIFDPADNVGWDAEPAGLLSLDWGSHWVRSKTSLLARVPSVIIPEETNVLVNPAHHDIDKARASNVRKWLYDARLAL